MVDEYGARSVLDIGCGTGTSACMLARRGLTCTHGPAAGWLLVFEARDPAAKAWLECSRQRSYRSAVVAGVGAVQAWEDVFDVSGGLVSFRSTFVFESDGAVLTSQSTSSSSSPDAPAMPIRPARSAKQLLTSLPRGVAGDQFRRGGPSQ